jgi:hypothetical protein
MKKMSKIVDIFNSGATAAWMPDNQVRMRIYDCISYYDRWFQNTITALMYAAQCGNTLLIWDAKNRPFWIQKQDMYLGKPRIIWSTDE